MFPPQIARLIFANNSGPELGLGVNRGGGPRRSVSLRFRQNHANTSTETTLRIEDNGGEETQAETNEDEHYRAFINRMRAIRQSRPNASFGPPAFGLTAFPGITPRPMTRAYRRDQLSASSGATTSASLRLPLSHAMNWNDVNAGRSADNALEIADDSDDEVEVVDVRRGRGV